LELALHPRPPLSPYTTLFRSPEVVGDRVLQDPLEQQRQFGRRTVGIAGGEPEHRVLHDVERNLPVANRVDRLLERSALGRGEERSEEHTSELQSRENLVCRLL